MLAKHISSYFANLHMDHSLKIEFISAFSWTGFNANQIYTQSRCYVWLKILWKYLWFWFGSSFTAIGLMIMHLGECTPRSFNFCSLWAVRFSGMLKESFDSNSRNKPGAGFVFLTKNVGSGVYLSYTQIQLSHFHPHWWSWNEVHRKELLVWLKEITMEAALELDEAYQHFESISYVRYRHGKENSEKGKYKSKKWKWVYAVKKVAKRKVVRAS